MEDQARQELQGLMDRYEPIVEMLKVATDKTMARAKELLPPSPSDIEDEDFRERCHRFASSLFLLNLASEADGDAAEVLGPLLQLGAQAGAVHMEVVDPDDPRLTGKPRAENELLGFDPAEAAERLLAQEG